jgi:hypothetical protein
VSAREVRCPVRGGCERGGPARPWWVVAPISPGVLTCRHG